MIHFLWRWGKTLFLLPFIRPVILWEFLGSSWLCWRVPIQASFRGVALCIHYPWQSPCWFTWSGSWPLLLSAAVFFQVTRGDMRTKHWLSSMYVSSRLDDSFPGISLWVCLVSDYWAVTLSSSPPSACSQRYPRVTGQPSLVAAGWGGSWVFFVIHY